VSVRIAAGRPPVFMSFILAALLLGPAPSHGSLTAKAASGAAAKPAVPRGAKRPVPPPFFSGRPDAARFRASSEAELKKAQDTIDRMLAVQGTHTIENTLTVYNEAMAHAENVAYQAHVLESAHPDSTYRASAEGISQTANKFLDDLSLNRPVYDALSSVDVSKADPGTQYFMMRTLRPEYPHRFAHDSAGERRRPGRPSRGLHQGAPAGT